MSQKNHIIKDKTRSNQPAGCCQSGLNLSGTNLSTEFISPLYIFDGIPLAAFVGGPAVGTVGGGTADCGADIARLSMCTPTSIDIKISTETNNQYNS